MAFQRVHQASSLTTRAQQYTSRFTQRPLIIQTQQDADQTFTQMADVQAQSIEQAMRFGHHFANTPVYPPDTQASAPVQPKQIAADHPLTSAGQRPNQTGLPDRLKAGTVARPLTTNNRHSRDFGTIQRRLEIRGIHPQTEEADVRQLLTYLSEASGLNLNWVQQTGRVTIPDNIDQVPDSALARMLVIMTMDERKTAQLLVGRNLQNVQFGSFPLESWQANVPNAQSQTINLDHIEAVEGAIQGLGVAIAAHEIWENYIAQKYRNQSGQFAKDKGHMAGVKVESMIADQLAGAGKRISEDIEGDGDAKIMTLEKEGFDRSLFGNDRQYTCFPSRIRYEKLTVKFNLFVQNDVYKIGNVHRQ